MKSRAHMKRRMDAVLALKNSITANRVGAPAHGRQRPLPAGHIAILEGQCESLLTPVGPHAILQEPVQAGVCPSRQGSTPAHRLA